MTDIVERLREATVDIETREPLFPEVFGHATVEELKEAADEIERLRETLEIISKPTYGTELFDTDEDRAEVYWQHLTRFQAIAKKALEK